MSAGFDPTPFRQFVVKVHSRCNLACDYCYLYRMADSSWRSRPTVMSAATVARVCERISEHVRTHGVDNLHVVFHGGEPLLAGSGFLAEFTRRLRLRLPPGASVDFAVQTNGTLLSQRTLTELAGHGIRIGVSLDSDRAATDRHRRTRNGGSSHAAVVAGLDLLCSPRFRSSFAGLLCVIDLANDPVTVYDTLVAYRPPQINFLLPHANWSQRPPGPATGEPYGRWLAQAFDRWYGAPVWETGVRLFDEIVNLLLGGQSTSEQVGLSPVATIVVDTDGSIEQVGSIRSAYHGAAGTNLNVHTDGFDAALRHPSIVARQIGAAALGPTCRRCGLLQVCGGGQYPHRYRADNGFRNPSVYCADLQFLIRHIADRLRRDVAELRRLSPPAGSSSSNKPEE